MSKVIWKFGTGQEIPEDAKYLCTQVETLEKKRLEGQFTENVLVWHYYELPLPRPEKEKQ